MWWVFCSCITRCIWWVFLCHSHSCIIWRIMWFFLSAGHQIWVWYSQLRHLTHAVILALFFSTRALTGWSSTFTFPLQLVASSPQYYSPLFHELCSNCHFVVSLLHLSLPTPDLVRLHIRNICLLYYYELSQGGFHYWHNCQNVPPCQDNIPDWNYPNHTPLMAISGGMGHIYNVLLANKGTRTPLLFNLTLPTSNGRSTGSIIVSSGLVGIVCW